MVLGTIMLQGKMAVPHGSHMVVCPEREGWGFMKRMG